MWGGGKLNSKKLPFFGEGGTDNQKILIGTLPGAAINAHRTMKNSKLKPNNEDSPIKN